MGHDHLPTPAGHTISDTSQDAVGLLGHLATLLAHVQPALDQHIQVLFCLGACQPLFPKPVTLCGVVVTQVQDLALGLVEPHTIGLGPSIQPVQIPLQSLPTLKQIDTAARLGVILELTEGALNPLIQEMLPVRQDLSGGEGAERGAGRWCLRGTERRLWETAWLAWAHQLCRISRLPQC